MKPFPSAQIIYPKDIMKLTGKGERYARTVHKKIREHYGKASHQLLTTSEVCQYFGIRQEDLTDK